MFNPVGLVSISLGSVVLDRPDQSGRFFAVDLAGGWAYLVGDAEGDNRFRGQGVCEGGLDMTLRCAFMAATNRVPECRQIRILVESRQAHRMMVQLAVKDPHVVAAIAGRPVSVMTRPEARSSYQVRSAAERAASTALRNREHAEWQKAAAASEVATDAALIAAPDILAPDTTKREVDTIQDWRARRSARIQQIPAVPGTDHRRPEDVAPMASTPTASIRSIIRPILRSARNGLTAAGVLVPNQDQRSRAVKAWLQELDSHVAMVRVDLEDVGA